MSGGHESLERGQLNREAMLGGYSILFFLLFYDLFIFTNHMAHAVLACRNDVCWSRPQRLAADIHADSRDQKIVVEQRISFIFGKGLLLKSGSFSVNFQIFSKVI